MTAMWSKTPCDVAAMDAFYRTICTLVELLMECTRT